MLVGLDEKKGKGKLFLKRAMVYAFSPSYTFDYKQSKLLYAV